MVATQPAPPGAMPPPARGPLPAGGEPALERRLPHHWGPVTLPVAAVPDVHLLVAALQQLGVRIA